MQDISSNISVTQLLTPVMSTTAKTSTSIDLQGFQACLVLIHIGFSLDTLGAGLFWTLKLQHSDNNSTWSDVVAADVNSGVTSYVVNSAALDEAVYKFGYLGNKRYLRAQALPTGTHTSGTPLGMIAVRGEAALMPVA